VRDEIKELFADRRQRRDEEKNLLIKFSSTKKAPSVT